MRIFIALDIKSGFFFFVHIPGKISMNIDDLFIIIHSQTIS